MKLAAYLTANEVLDVVFAEKLGVTRQTLWRYKSGERRPEWDVLERIKRETGGQVTPNDFLDDAPPIPCEGQSAVMAPGEAHA